MKRGLRVLVLAIVAGCLFAPARASAEIVEFTSGRTLSVKSHRIEGELAVLVLRTGGEVTCAARLIVGSAVLRSRCTTSRMNRYCRNCRRWDAARETGKNTAVGQAIRHRQLLGDADGIVQRDEISQQQELEVPGALCADRRHHVG